MINPYNKNRRHSSTTVGTILSSSSSSNIFEMSSSQEENMVRTTDLTLSKNVRVPDDEELISENKSSTIESSPVNRDKKRAKLLTSDTNESTYKVYDHDGLLVAEDGHLNALLLLWKDTVLLEVGDFGTDHILPVVAYSTSHWWDEEFITNTARCIATNLRKLRMKMNVVVTELEHDEWWMHDVVQQINDKLGNGSELAEVEDRIRSYKDKVALQVLTCRSLAIKLRMTNANMAVLVHKCVQEKIVKLTFKPNMDQKSFTFHVTFGNDDEWHLDVDGVINKEDNEPA